MSKKNLHIKKYLHGKLPEPEVQVDDAWAQMNDMFGGDNPTPDPQVPGTGTFSALLKGGLGILAGLGITALTWFLLPDHKEQDKTTINAENQLHNPISTQYPAGHTHPENDANVSTKQQVTLDSTGHRSLPVESHIANDSIASIDKPIAKTPKNKKLAIGTAASTASKTANAILKINKNDVDKRQTQSDLSKSETNNPAAVRFKTQPKNEKLSAGNNTKKSTPGPDLNAQNADEPNTIRINNAGPKKVKTAEENSGDTFNPEPAATTKNQVKPLQRILFPVQTLTSKSVSFHYSDQNLAKKVQYNAMITKRKTISPKEKKPLFETLHVGLEWNITSGLNHAKYIFTATDSTHKPFKLLIPGIWISKDLSEKQSVTLSFYANQAYFGGSKRIQRMGADSAIFRNNINLIKATGVNFSLSYNHRIVSKLGVSAGISYSPLRSALTQNDLENHQGKIIPVSKLLLKKDNIDQYMKTSLFLVKTGLAFTPGRYQLGVNLLIPVSNLSITSTSSLKTINGQFFFKVSIK